ncbi:predicted protein [Histoplasma capsulatum var. duboisii H88]|uniref:Predicted protein n=1 Tax=Ajellomyces capsulatus (strain H88) TaxID=544711 RepID=F0UTA4_AJEC8|nr:predicted protein [Histoplasma capsulatum var. duboisii H88]
MLESSGSHEWRSGHVSVILEADRRSAQAPIVFVQASERLMSRTPADWHKLALAISATELRFVTMAQGRLLTFENVVRESRVTPWMESSCRLIVEGMSDSSSQNDEVEFEF